MYQQALPTIDNLITQQKAHAQHIVDTLMSKGLADRVWYGDNAFMAIAYTTDIAALQQYCLAHGVETATHFARAIDWAKQFGYVEGTCPMAEKLTKKLLS